MEKIKNYTISLGISFLVSVIFLCLSAVIFAYTNISDRHLQTFVFGIMLISVLVGSTLFSRKNKKRGLVYGALFGLFYCVIIYLITVLGFTGFFFSNTLALYLGISVLAGVVGGIIGVNI